AGAATVFSEDSDEFAAVGREMLHAFDEVVFGNVQFTARIHGNGTREREVAGICSFVAPLRNEFAFGCEMVDAFVVGLDQNDVAVFVAIHAFWFAFFGVGK